MERTENKTRSPRIRSARQGHEPREFTHADAVAMGSRIREERENLGQTKLELAMAVDVSERTITSLENGEANPKFELIRKLSDYLNMPLDYIAWGKVA